MHGACDNCGCALGECECTDRARRVIMEEITLRGEVVAYHPMSNGVHIIRRLVDPHKNAVLEPARVRIFRGKITAYGKPGHPWLWLA